MHIGIDPGLSGAAGSGNEARADAGSRQVQYLVRRRLSE
jgi:hypothetical protein